MGSSSDSTVSWHSSFSKSDFVSTSAVEWLLVDTVSSYLLGWFTL